MIFNEKTNNEKKNYKLPKNKVFHKLEEIIKTK